MKMETTCAMVGCYNTIDDNSDHHFYPFPKDFDLCMLWVQNCGRAELFEDFAYGGAQPFIHKTICTEHFSASDFTDATCLSKGLKQGAFPVLREESQLVIVKEELELDDCWNENNQFNTSDPLESYIKVEPTEIGNECVNSANECKEPEQPSHNVENADKLSTESYMPLLVVADDQVLLQDRNISLSQRSQNAFQTAWKRALESTEQREARNRANALRNAFRRANETEEERKARNQANALRNATRRASESEDQRKDRLYKNAIRAALRRSMESDEEQKERRRKNAMRAACRRSSETEEQRAERRLKDKIRSAERRQKETDLESKLRKYNDAVRAAFRRSNETETEKQQRRLYDVMRASHRRFNETDDQRAKRLEADRERAAKRRLLKGCPNSTFLNPELESYVNSLRSGRENIKTENDTVQYISDSFEVNLSNDDLSNHSYTYSESESLGNTNISYSNFNSVCNEHNAYNEVGDFNSSNTTIDNNLINVPIFSNSHIPSGSNEIMPALIEPLVNNDTPEVISHGSNEIMPAVLEPLMNNDTPGVTLSSSNEIMPALIEPLVNIDITPEVVWCT